MGKGLKHHEHDSFPYTISENTTIKGLIDALHSDFGERFDVYLEDPENRLLRKDAIVIVSGANMVTKEGLDTKLSRGDLVVFMIAAVGG